MLYICNMKYNLIDVFKKSQDYIDICYMIDHIQNTEIRVDLLKQLGYNIVIFNNKIDNVKHITITKNGNIVIQITPKIKIIGISRFIIFNKKYFTKWL